MLLRIFPIIFYFGLCNSQGFIADQKCLYNELGASSNFEITPHVDFYIPHNWVNNDHKLNYLHIKLFSRDLVLRHPASLNRNPSEIHLPIEDMKIGWNRIYLRRDGNNMNVIVRPVEDNSIKTIQKFIIKPTIKFPNEQETLHVSGLNSLVECQIGLNTRYYKIPAGKTVTIPYVLFKQVDRFDTYSETNPFNFEISFSGKRRQICKEEIRDSPDVYSVPKECKHWPVNQFSKDTEYNIYMYPAAFEKEDILRYKDFTFTDFQLHNTGNTDFYIRTFMRPESNAPISLITYTSTITPAAVKPPSSVSTVEPTVIISAPPGEKGCGINSKTTVDDRIAGGTTANSIDWPWMVALIDNSDGLGVNEVHVCGGVLISERHVLTAANCLNSTIYEDIKVRLGENDISTDKEGIHTDIGIEGVIIHESFNSDTLDNDIAIIRLEKPADKSFPPVCLPPPNIDWEDQYGYITGWGKILTVGPKSTTLKEAFVQIWKEAECADIYSLYTTITQNNLCAGGRDGKGSCEGDTGGPLMVQILPQRQWYLVGIDSWGILCKFNPAIYTRVDQYIDWIEKNTVI